MHANGFSRQEGAVLWLAQNATELLATFLFNNYILIPFVKPSSKPFLIEICDSSDNMSHPDDLI